MCCAYIMDLTENPLISGPTELGQLQELLLQSGVILNIYKM